MVAETVNAKSNLLKLIPVLIVFAVLYYVYGILKVEDISTFSALTEKNLVKVFYSFGIRDKDVVSSFQTEKKAEGIKWIKFTKIIDIEYEEYAPLKSALKKEFKDEPVIVKEEKYFPEQVQLNIIHRDIGVTVNTVQFNLLDEKNLLAIIVDDLGYHKDASGFLEIDIPLTFSILPQLPYSKHLAREFYRDGRPYMLHMPMEPEGYPEYDPGHLALMKDMPPQDIKNNIEEALKQVPGAKGLNNHMGSAFTADRAGMKMLMEILKEKDLFYVDSMTTSRTVGPELAAGLEIKWSKNNFFIDNKDDYDFILDRLKQLRARAQNNKRTVAICHPKKNTLLALKDYKNKLKDSSFRIVSVSEVLK